MEYLNEYIGSHIRLETKQGLTLANMVSRKIVFVNKLVGTNKYITALDTMIHNIKFPGGHYED